jgi:multidrug efflux system membrane fusion protein
MSGSTLASPSARLPIRGVVLVLLAIVILFGGLALWKRARTMPAAAGAPPPTPVSAMVVEPQTVPAALQSVGALQAVRQVTLAPQVSGRVVAIRFEGGARVGVGAVLVQLDDAPERADRAAAAAKVQYAKLMLERSQRLQPQGYDPKQLLDQRQSDYDQAVAAVHQLDARIAQMQVRAPFAGELGLRRVNPGQYLNPGDPIVTLTALDSLFVNFTLPQQELGKVRIGGAVEVTADAWPDRVFAARVNAIEPVVGSDTRNVSVQALLPNPDGALRPGMYVTARLALPPQTGALTVPATAITTSAAGDSVVVIRGPEATRGGTAQPVPIEAGRRVGDRVVIAGGLKPGDVVITDGQLRVQPGSRVSVTARGGRGG